MIGIDAKDGRFLMIRIASDPAAVGETVGLGRFIFVQNWFEEMKERLGER